MPWTIEIDEGAMAELESLRKYDQQQIEEEIDAQLLHQPNVATRKRKIIEGLSPDFEYDPPLWQLRVGEFRVFYDLDEERETVTVRAIRKKSGGATTEEIV